MDQAYLTWLQNDPRFNRSEAWPAQKYPDSPRHFFSECGCLVCSLAVMLRHYDIEKTADETAFDPWILNQRLIECGAFTPAADLELLYIDRLYPLEYLGAVPYSREALVQIAECGLPCLITVPGINAVKHFKALCRLLPDDAVVFDPLYGERMISSYEKVYEIRIFRAVPCGTIDFYSPDGDSQAAIAGCK